MDGIRAIRKRSPWPIRRIHAGETAPGEFANGRAEIIAFLKRKWSRELDYRLRPG